MPVWVSLALILGFRALTVAVNRDGRAVNILMLLHPLAAVRQGPAGIGP